jgi:hypothetical protein
MTNIRAVVKKYFLGGGQLRQGGGLANLKIIFITFEKPLDEGWTKQYILRLLY